MAQRMGMKGWIIVILLAIIAVMVWQYLQPRSGINLLSYIQQDHVTRVLAIDLNYDNHVSEPGVLHGDDALLVIHMSTVPSNHRYDLVEGYADLYFFDVNQDSIIEPGDAVYSRVELMFRDRETGQIQFTPLARAGVRAIYLLQKYPKELLVSQQTTLQLNAPYIEGKAIMADGSIRYVRSLAIYSAIIPHKV